MKYLTVILSLIILLLSVKPCSDGLNIEDQHQDEMSIGHNHQEDSNDSCSVACICSCCGMSIAYEPVKTYSLIEYHKISTELISTYEPIYRFNFLSNIWQPPQVIS